MRVLADEGVALDRMFAHGGMFRTAGVAQRFLAGALDAPVSVADTASEGGSWGIAVLAAFAHARRDADERGELDAYLRDRVFGGFAFDTVVPHPEDVAGFAAYLDRYRDGLVIEHAAIHDAKGGSPGRHAGGRPQSEEIAGGRQDRPSVAAASAVAPASEHPAPTPSPTEGPTT
jgi:hypothetical protein